MNQRLIYPDFPPDGPIDPDPDGPISPVDPIFSGLPLGGSDTPPVGDPIFSGLPIPVEDEFCTTPIPDDFCLPTRPLQHWVCSQYSGGYNQNNLWHGNYNGNEVPAWKPVLEAAVRPFCSCSSLFITSNASLGEIIRG